MLYRGTGGAIGGTVGGILGAIGSLGFGTGIGIAGGAGIGQMIGGFISDLSKTKDEADVKEFLKFLGQTAGIGNSFVEQARGYEIGELSGAVKYGSNFRGRQISGYGITPQEELAYKNMFGDSLRDYDSELFQDQTLFARQFRLDPSSIYQMNQLTRFTGERIGSQQLSEGRDLAQRIYGEDASTERTIDVLKAIKDINMQMLRFDEKADFETSRRIAELPGLIMGKDSPYGKISEMGMDTIGALQGLGQGQDPISQVMLYQAYGENNPINFMRRMQRGFFGQQGNNAQDIFKFLRNLGQIDPFSAEMYLTNMIPNADINEELSSIFTSNDPTQFNKILESLSNGKPIDEALKDVGIKTSRFEINQESIQEQIISSGQKVADTFLSMNEKMIDYQSTIIQSTEAQEQLKKSLEESFKYLDNNLSKWGIIGIDEKIEGNVRSKATEELIKRGLSKDQAKFIADQTAGSNVNQIIENIVKQADSIPQLSDLSIKNLTEELKSYFENQKKYFDESKLNIEIILKNEDGTPANAEVRTFGNHLDGSNFKF
jgi:hypothetical protein